MGRAYRLGLMPWDYERLQPFEVVELEEAARWRRDREWEQRATVTAVLSMPNAKEGVLFEEMLRDIKHALPGYRPEE